MDNGYVDITDNQLLTLNILFGGRGLGKTFSILKHRIENSLASDNESKKFIWLRDSAEVVKKIAAGNSLAAPICRVYPEFPKVTIEKSGSNYCFVADAKTDNYRILGYLAAVSTFHNARGISYEDVVNITWDEFIPEEGTIVKKNMGMVYLNLYETVNRNRELEGDDPVQMIFLSNTNDIYCDVLECLGINTIIEDMLYKNQKVYRNNGTWIEFLSSEKFLAKKKETFIYKINKNSKFNEMALNNKFSNNLALVKRNVDYKGSIGLLTVAGNYTLIQLADGSLYFKYGAWKNLINYDMDNDQEAILFRLLFNDKLRLQYIAGRMFFDSIYTQRKILDWARI